MCVAVVLWFFYHGFHGDCSLKLVVMRGCFGIIGMWSRDQMLGCDWPVAGKYHIFVGHKVIDTRKHIST